MLPASPCPQLATYSEANYCLRDLGLAQRRQQEIALRAQEEIDLIKARADAESAPWAENEKLCTSQLKAFLKSRRKEFRDDRRTVELTFGKIGYRTPPATLKLDRGHSEADVIAALKRKYRAEWDSYVQVRETLRRDEIKFSFDVEALSALGLSLDQTEQPVIEPRLDVDPEAGTGEAA